MFDRARRFLALANAARRLAKTQPDVGSERVRQHLQSRINPIRNLTPASLVQALDQFDRGYLRTGAQLWQKIKDRDDAIRTVSAKREQGVAMLDWEIMTLEESPEADAHKQALEDFYNSITTTNAIDTNERGGVSKLISQMMHSVGHKYAAHEIVWKPRPGGLSADFRFVPLQFFENTLGRLRFLETDFAPLGVDLEHGGWMVTCGPGLMEASAIAYLYKKLPLQSWVILCEKFAVPYLHGTTAATFGSDEWNAMRDALAAFAADGSVLTSAGSDIKPITITGNDAPQKELVDRMDRAIARLWLGGDLSTMSQLGDATGSNAQSGDADIFEAADALNISETLQHFVDRQVIAYRFGTEPKAFFKINPSAREDLQLQLAIDTYLRDSGVEQSKNDLRARYGRAEPEPGEPLATAPVGGFLTGDGTGTALPPIIGSQPRSGEALEDSGSAVAAGGEVQSTALNGAQIASLAELANKVATGELPLDSAKSVAAAAFPLISPAQLDAIFRPLLNFKQSPKAVASTALANAAPDARAFLKKAQEQYAPAVADVVRPLLEDLATIEGIQDEAEQRAALEAFRDRLPEIYAAAVKRVPAAAAVLERVIGSAAVSGLAEAAQKHSPPAKS